MSSISSINDVIEWSKSRPVSGRTPSVACILSKIASSYTLSTAVAISLLNASNGTTIQQDRLCWDAGCLCNILFSELVCVLAKLACDLHSDQSQWPKEISWKYWKAICCNSSAIFIKFGMLRIDETSPMGVVLKPCRYI